MPTHTTGLRFVLALVVISFLAACARDSGKDWVDLGRAPGSDDSTQLITGTIDFLDLEGGVYVIRNAEGTVFHPVNLPKAFQASGMAVEAEAGLRPDVATTAMAGTDVELYRIRKLPGGTPETASHKNRPAAAAAKPDFRAMGTEPGWVLDISRGHDMHLSYAYGEQEFTVPLPEPEVDPETGVETYHADTTDHDFLVVIEPTPCVDDARGATHEAAVTVTIDGMTLRGCGDSLHAAGGR